MEKGLEREKSMQRNTWLLPRFFLSFSLKQAAPGRSFEDWVPEYRRLRLLSSFAWCVAAELTLLALSISPFASLGDFFILRLVCAFMRVCEFFSFVDALFSLSLSSFLPI